MAPVGLAHGLILVIKLHGVQRFGERREYSLSATNAGAFDGYGTIDDTPVMDEKAPDITPESSESV